MPEERNISRQTQNQPQPKQRRPNPGQFQKGSDRAREAGRKGGKKSH